jgi:mono/diheme cytochrome c family protein
MASRTEGLELRNNNRRPVSIAISGLVLLAWVAVAAGQDRRGGQGRDVWADHLPPGKGKELAAQSCGSCHTLERTVQLRQSRDGWEATVYDMVGRGAPILLDEAKEIITYYSNVFGPDAPPLIDVNRASKEELLKVRGITAELASRLIAYREANGPLASRDNVREILGLEEKAFEDIRYYLRAVPPSASPAGSTASPNERPN